MTSTSISALLASSTAPCDDSEPQCSICFDGPAAAIQLPNPDVEAQLLTKHDCCIQCIQDHIRVHLLDHGMYPVKIHWPLDKSTHMPQRVWQVILNSVTDKAIKQQTLKTFARAVVAPASFRCACDEMRTLVQPPTRCAGSPEFWYTAAPALQQTFGKWMHMYVVMGLKFNYLTNTVIDRVVSGSNGTHWERRCRRWCTR